MSKIHKETRNSILAWIIFIILVCLSFMVFIMAEWYRGERREAQKAAGEFSGYVSSVEPIRQDGTTVSVSITFRIDNVDPEIIVLGPEFAGLSENDLLYLTGCKKNPTGFWENCVVNFR
jgi:hypothetical protein